MESSYSTKKTALDKRDFISGTVLDPEGLFKLLTGKRSLGMIFSLQQVCNMPLPCYPSIYNYDEFQVIAIHNPYPADFQGKPFSSLSKLVEIIIKELLNPYKKAKQVAKDAANAVKHAADALADAIGAVTAFFSGHVGRARRRLNHAKDELKKALKAVENTWKDLTDFFDPFRDILNGIGDLKPDPPRTTKEEEEYVTEGFAYFTILSKLEESLESFFKSVISGNFESLATALMNPTRLIHLQDRAPYGGFSSDGGFTLSMTLNVPPGRSLKFGPIGGAESADFVVLGDVWLQRGSSLVVEGNLYVQTPNTDVWQYGGEPLELPTGTIFLEEGASLMVTGDLYAQGSAPRGSIVLCSPYGLRTPVSNAVLVKGDVRLPAGITSGVALNKVLEKLVPNVQLVGPLLHDILDPLLTELAPKLAKSVGPFKARKCWFAKYASTFVLIPELAEFGLQGPWPIPLPYRNCMVKTFTNFSKVSGIVSNFSLGDNLMTHCSWWILDSGIVPVIPKVEPGPLEDAARRNVTGEGEGLDKDALLKSLEGQLKNVIKTVVDAVFKEAIQAAIQSAMASITGIEDRCAKEGESSELDQDATFRERMEAGLKKSLKTRFKRLFKEFKREAKRSQDRGLGESSLKELPGVLLYSGGKLTIGDGTSLSSTALGFLIADGDVDIQVEHTIGAVASRTGNITIDGKLHYYPYFTQAFLYIPEDVEDYGFLGSPPSWLKEYADIFQDGLYFKIPDSGKPVDILSPVTTVTAEGRIAP